MTDALVRPEFWAYLLTMIPFLLFALLYGITKPRLWVNEPVGRGLMILSTTLVLVIVNVLLGYTLANEHLLRVVLRYVVLAGGFVSGWYMLVTLLRLQREGRQIRATKAAQNYGRRYDDEPRIDART